MFVSSPRADPRQAMRKAAESEFRDDSSAHGSDDDSTSHGASDRGTVPKLAEEKEISARDAARATNCVGYGVLLILLLAGTMLAILTHFYVKGEEQADFDAGFHVSALELLAAVDRNSAHVQDSLHTVALLYPTQADSTPEDSPLVTLPNFEVFAQAARTATGAPIMAYTPFVWDDDARSKWQSYSEREQGWLKYAAAFDPALDATTLEPIKTNLWLRNGNGVAMTDPGPDPYAPVWQVSPPDPGIVNFNLASDISVEAWMGAQVNGTSFSFLSEPIFATALLGVNSEQVQDNPVPTSLAILPVAASLLEPPQDVTGALVAVIPWTTFFENVLPAAAPRVSVVVNSCGQQHSYDIQGTDVIFVGNGDFHDSTYEPSAVTGVLGSFAMGTKRNSVVPCTHQITVYATRVNEDSYESNAPFIFAIGAGTCFFFAIVLFLFYDCYVRRQQNRVVGQAERSNAIVASLFPKQVARRLFQDPGRRSGVMDTSNHSANLMNFVTRSERKAANTTVDDRPIAELFPEATVMFGDIAGFTAWSSIREPTHVFLLLESIFQAFDELARKAGVFKVETVGDCYVAVCGVPEANHKHAEVMARFARDCLDQFNNVVRGLELKLGPDTGDLALRIGLNSGPVTAGVLRGERARFQLFGDTVNTAARIESTGQRDRIHLSDHTAKQLINAGHEDWVKHREDVVEAKGKGLINTFWLVLDECDEDILDDSPFVKQGVAEQAPMDDYEGSTNASEKGPVLKPSSSLYKNLDVGNARKIERLVAWNSELLLQLLKHIVAKRTAVAGRRMTQVALRAMAQHISSGGMVVDEVTEIIQLPDFDERATNKVDVSAVKLSPEVISQTKRYVSLIASMYKQNPFHNFEHASHVTMSVSKLLSRIVAPQFDKETTAKQQEELVLHDHTYGITSDPLTQFAVVLSALIHDVDHRGVPNGVLAEEDKYLASVYQNKSIAEQNSVDLAWNTLMEDEFEALRSTIFSDISELKRFRQLMVNSVIATDIFDKEQSKIRKDRWAKAFSVAQTDRTTKDIHRMATIVIEHLIQASDVAHTMQHWHVYRKWNERLFEEMYGAYQNGRTKKDPSLGWAKGEIWFFDFYVIPLAKKLKECGVFGVSSDEYLNYALENRQEWEAKGASIVETLVAKYGKK